MPCLWAMAVVRFAIERRAGREGKDAALSSSIDIIVFIASITIYAMALLLALDNLGVEIKPLLAGLGIGGIAVALAVQTVLGDLFDVGVKANRRNVDLLERYLGSPKETKKASRGVVALILLAAVLLIVGVIAAGVWLIRLLSQLI